MKLKGIEIQPGFVIVCSYSTYIAFPTDIEENKICFVDITEGCWKNDISKEEIIQIHSRTKDINIDSGDVLWDINNQIKEISMDMIAERFGVPVEKIKIVK